MCGTQAGDLRGAPGPARRNNRPSWRSDYALIDAVAEALDLAHLGRTAEGYAVLLQECHRAREVAAGQEWEGALLERWRGVLERSPASRAPGSGGRWGGHEAGRRPFRCRPARDQSRIQPA